MLSPEQITAIAYNALEDKKAKDVKILKTAEHTVLEDYFVICNGSSSAHIKALVEEVDKKLSEAGEPPLRREGLRSDIWVLMDFGSSGTPVERCRGGDALIPSEPLIRGIGKL